MVTSLSQPSQAAEKSSSWKLQAHPLPTRSEQHGQNIPWAQEPALYQLGNSHRLGTQGVAWGPATSQAQNYSGWCIQENHPNRHGGKELEGDPWALPGLHFFRALQTGSFWGQCQGKV